MVLGNSFFSSVAKLSIVIPSTGAFWATFFSSSNVFAFFATKVDLLETKDNSTYGSFSSSNNSSTILLVITEL